MALNMIFFPKYKPVRILIAILFGFFISCERPSVKLTSTYASEKKDLREEILPLQQELPLIITYHRDSITSPEELEEIKNTFSAEAQQLIFALNRIDSRYIQVGAVLIVPDTFTSRFLDYSPFPQKLEMIEKIPRTILISRRVQAFGLYEAGDLIKWGPVSTGKRSTPTPAGLFYGNYKAKRKISTVNDSWIMPYYFNFMNFEGVGVHQYAMPGYPASHACVRLYMDDAKWIYDWAGQWKLDPAGREILKNGTPFMVFGTYNFDEEVPWLALEKNHNANFLTAEEMKTLRGYVETYFQDERNFDPPILNNESFSISSREGLETIR